MAVTIYKSLADGVNYKSTVSDAIRKARQFADAFRGIPPFTDEGCECTPGKSSLTGHNLAWDAALVTKRLAEAPRAVFLYRLGKYFGGVRVFKPAMPAENNEFAQYENVLSFTGLSIDSLVANAEVRGDKVLKSVRKTMMEVPIDSAESLKEVKWSVPIKDHARVEDSKPFRSIVVLPLTKSVIVDGETHTYQWIIYDEGLKEVSDETYIEVYVNHEGGIKSPGDVISVSLKGGWKAGRKASDKDAVRKGARIAAQVSKSIILRTLARNVYIFSDSGEYFRLEHGCQVERQEVGDLLDLSWPHYDSSGKAIADSARNKALAPHRKMIIETAIDLAKRTIGK